MEARNTSRFHVVATGAQAAITVDALCEVVTPARTGGTVSQRDRHLQVNVLVRLIGKGWDHKHDVFQFDAHPDCIIIAPLLKLLFFLQHTDSRRNFLIVLNMVAFAANCRTEDVIAVVALLQRIHRSVDFNVKVRPTRCTVVDERDHTVALEVVVGHAARTVVVVVANRAVPTSAEVARRAHAPVADVALHDAAGAHDGVVEYQRDAVGIKTVVRIRCLAGDIGTNRAA